MDYFTPEDFAAAQKYIGRTYKSNSKSGDYYQLIINKLYYLIQLCAPNFRNSFSQKPYTNTTAEKSAEKLAEKSSEGFKLVGNSELFLGFIPAPLMAVGDKIFIGLRLNLANTQPILSIQLDSPPAIENNPYSEWLNENAKNLYWRFVFDENMPKDWAGLQAIITPILRANSQYLEALLLHRQAMQPLNQIFYGPAGTGKTYQTIAAALSIIGDEEATGSRQEQRKAFDNRLHQKQIRFLTFHQSMSYEDFIEGIKPSVSDSGQVQYHVQAGLLSQIAAEASQSWINEATPRNFVLIIDEINRGNVSQIFGELITLLEADKRIGQKEHIELILPYSKKPFSLPPNLYIIGTMNTADKSIEALDIALRRRFSFRYFAPQPELLSPSWQIWRLLWEHETLGWQNASYPLKINALFELIRPAAAWLNKQNPSEKLNEIWAAVSQKNARTTPYDYLKDEDFEGINLAKLLSVINQRISQLLGVDKQIGHSYLMNVYSLGALKTAFAQQIIPLLEEYFWGDYGKIGLVLGERFFYPPTHSPILAKFYDYSPQELSFRQPYQLRDVANMSISDFEKAVLLLQ
jgi:hypothetical protein